MKFKLSRKYLILLCLILALGLGAFFWQMSIAGKGKISDVEKEKKLQEMLGRELRKEKKNRTAQKYEGKFFFLTYPGTLEVNNKVNPQATQSAQPKEILKLQQFDPARVNLVAMVLDGKNISKLADYSAVKFRRSEKDLYKEEQLKVDSAAALVFSKSLEGAEKTAFLSLKGDIYSFSVTGQNFEEVQRIFNEVIKTITFKNP
jgi:hypothetical protein